MNQKPFSTSVSTSNFTNWADYTNNTTLSITNRGYTTHEHMPQYGLINMNGRLYDPTLSRMLNADPFIADATSAQDFNRYSYVRNNPLKYTDPSGYRIGKPRYGHRKYVKRGTQDVLIDIPNDFFDFGDYWGNLWGNNADGDDGFGGGFGGGCAGSGGGKGGGYSGGGGGGIGFSLPEFNIPIPRFVIRFPDMVKFRRKIKGNADVLPYEWGIKKVSFPLNFGWDYIVTDLPNLTNPVFNYNNTNWFRMKTRWPTNPGIAVTGTVDGVPASAFNRIRPDGTAVDAMGRPVIGFNATYSNGASISLNFPAGTVYNITISTRTRRQINIPFYYLDLGFGFWNLIF